MKRCRRWNNESPRTQSYHRSFTHSCAGLAQSSIVKVSLYQCYSCIHLNICLSNPRCMRQVSELDLTETRPDFPSTTTTPPADLLCFPDHKSSYPGPLAMISSSKCRLNNPSKHYCSIFESEYHLVPIIQAVTCSLTVQGITILQSYPMEP